MASSPERIGAKTIGRIVVSVHLETVASDVVREAARRLDLPHVEKMKAGSALPSVRLKRHALVDITVDVPGLVFETTQSSLHLWEDQQFVEFRFKPMPSSVGLLCRGWVHFWLEGVVLADVAVAILVEADDVPEIFRNALVEANARPYRFVFPSYSHEDTEAVERLESYAESFGDTYLRDVRSLRVGQQWNEELRGFIKKANVFQLFWSENAARSRYVKSEWECALSERTARPDPYFVRPIYWTDTPAEIPEELSSIHFAKVPLIGHAPLARRQDAAGRILSGDYPGAEELLRGLLQERFAVASTHCHLARVLLMTDRVRDARQEINEAWAIHELAPSYVVPRILFFQSVFNLLDGAEVNTIVGQIKVALRVPDAHLEWIIQPMLDHLRSQLGETNYQFLKALAEALSDPKAMPHLDEFPQWRNAAPDMSD